MRFFAGVEPMGNRIPRAIIRMQRGPGAGSVRFAIFDALRDGAPSAKMLRLASKRA